VHDLGLVVAVVLLVDDLLDAALDNLGDVVDVLRLDDRLEVVLEDLREVVLQLRPAVVLQDLDPVRLVLQGRAACGTNTSASAIRYPALVPGYTTMD
jgi:hypothetical protein